MTTISSTSGPQLPTARPDSSVEYKQATDDRSVVVSQFEKLLANFNGADMEQMMETLAQLHVLTSKLQGNVTNARIDSADLDRKEASKKMLEMMHAVLTKINEAKAAVSEDKVLGWLAAIGEMVGAGLLLGFVVYSAAVTGGASVPLVSLTAAMLVTATMAVANMGAKETGLQHTNALGETKQINISIDGMVDDIVAQQIADGTIVEVRTDSNGNFVKKSPITGLDEIIKDPREGAKPGAIFMSPEQISKWKMGWSITANLIVAAAMMSMGMGAAEFAAKGATGATKVATAAELVNIGMMELGTEAVQVLTGAIEAALGIVQGTSGLKLAEIDLETAQARNRKELYEATVKEITQRLSVMISTLQQIVNSVNDNYKGTSQVLKESTETSANTNRRISA